MAQFSRSQQDLMCENIAFYTSCLQYFQNVVYWWLSDWDGGKNIGCVNLWYPWRVKIYVFAKKRKKCYIFRNWRHSRCGRSDHPTVIQTHVPQGPLTVPRGLQIQHIHRAAAHALIGLGCTCGRRWGCSQLAWRMCFGWLCEWICGRYQNSKGAFQNQRRTFSKLVRCDLQKCHLAKLCLFLFTWLLKVTQSLICS